MKTTHRTDYRARDGSGLLIVMMALMVVLFAAGAVLAMTTHMPRMVRRQCDFIRAKAIAEAGINEAYSRLVEDFSLRENPDAFPAASFAGGSYRIALQPIDDGTIILVSTGTFGTAETHTSVEVGRRDLPGAGFGSNSPWGHAVFSNGDLNFNGTPEILGGMHTNQNFGVNGNLDNISGTVTAQSYPDDFPAGQRGEWNEIPFPQLTDQAFVDLHQTAQSNGAVLDGGTYRADDLAGKSGDVLWFTGDVTFHGDFTFDGYVVVAGNVIFRGSGHRTVDGLLYVQGNVTCNGAIDMDLNGSLLAGGSILFNGGAGVFSYEASAPPGVDPDDDELITISAWRE